jgi:ParB family chromosome partitioning protein
MDDWIELIDVDKIKPDKDQPRKQFDEEKLKELAETYKTQGIIQPIEVDENLIIITGERRWRAAKLAGLEKIPCRIIKGLTPEQKLERRLIENIHHEPLTEMEKAEAIKKLIEMKGWNPSCAAQVLGVNEQYLRRLLSLIEAPKEVKELVEERKIDPSTAGEIVYSLKKKPEKIVEVAKKVVKAESKKRELARKIIAEIKRREEAEKRREEIAKIEQSLKETDIIIKLGDFRDLIKEIEPNSVDLILTDPPYPKEFFDLWRKLAEEAKRVLKAGGFLVCYSGQYYLPEIFEEFKKHLEYYWLAGLNHIGEKRMLPNLIVNRMKPILIFYKPPLKKNIPFCDLIDSPAPDKTYHEWQQSIEPAEYLISSFSAPNDLILDPFVGTGTFAIAAMEKKRKFIGFEIDPNLYNIALRRLNEWKNKSKS